MMKEIPEPRPEPFSKRFFEKKKEIEVRSEKNVQEIIHEIIKLTSRRISLQILGGSKTMSNEFTKGLPK